MIFEHFWRVIGTVAGTAYVYLAFRAGRNGHPIWLGVDCMIAGLYYFAAAKSHSRMKKNRWLG